MALNSDQHGSVAPKYSIMALAYAIEQNKDVYMIGNEYELYDILNQQKIKHIENYGELESAV